MRVLATACLVFACLFTMVLVRAVDNHRRKGDVDLNPVELILFVAGCVGTILLSMAVSLGVLIK